MALESTYQFIVMTFKDGVSAIEKYDHYEFFIVMRDEAEYPPTFSFSEKDEASITAPEVVFEPDVRRSIADILRSFEMDEDFDVVGNAIDGIILAYGGDENDVPFDVSKLKKKKELSAEDYVMLADECQTCDDERFAAKLYAAAYYSEAEPATKGEALVQLADLYMNSDWPKNGGREWDVMKAVDLLTEALTLGCVKEAKDALEGMR